MKQYLIILTVLLTSFSANPQTDFNRAALQFTFEGISLGTTRTAFKSKCPMAFIAKDDDSSSGVKSYTLDTLATAWAATYRFLDDTLFFVGVMYSEDQISNMGGVMTLVQKLIKKIGKPNDVKDLEGKKDYSEAAIWDFSERVGRTFEIATLKDGTVILRFYDDNKLTKLTKRKAANADVGF